MNTDHTLEGRPQFSVTRERIQQIEAEALRKLKHPSRSRKLRSFLGDFFSCQYRITQKTLRGVAVLIAGYSSGG